MERKEFEYHEIFVPGGMPQYTYNPRKKLELENKLIKVEKGLCKLMVVTGLTKSGKTVMVNKLFPRHKTIWFDGGIFSNENDFWNYLLEQLKGFTQVEEHKKKSTQKGIKGILEGQIGIPFLVNATSKGEVSATAVKEKTTVGKRSMSDKTAVLANLREKKIPVIIDDFHYIPRDEQAKIVRAFKSLVFDGVPIIFIAIPHRRYDAIKVEREMAGRVENVNIPAWDIEELKNIAKTGFPFLNADVIDDIMLKMAEESFGSPHLMQEFCKQFCEKYGIIKRERKPRLIEELELDDIFNRVAEDSGRQIYEKLKKGPRQRTDRIQRKLKNGNNLDIYGVILTALSYLKPKVQTIDYETIRTAIREVLDEKMPQINEISRVLSEMSKISMNDESSTPVIDWDKEEKVLHITDPFFAFFLKWSNIK